MQGGKPLGTVGPVVLHRADLYWTWDRTVAGFVGECGVQACDWFVQGIDLNVLISSADVHTSAAHSEGW